MITDTSSQTGSATPSGSEILGRRERKKRQTRHALEDAAWRLFLRKGFDATTVDDITEAVDVSQRTFFRHFPSKEAVLFADLEDQLERVAEAFERRPADEPLVTAVRGAILSLADDFTARREQHLLRARVGANTPAVATYQRTVVQSAFEEAIASAVAQRLGVDPETDLRPNLVAGAASAAMGAAYTAWMARGGEGEFTDLVDEAFDTLASEVA